MDKKICIMILMICILTGCAAPAPREVPVSTEETGGLSAGNGTETGVEENDTSLNGSEAELTTTVSLRIVDGVREGELLLAGETAEKVYVLSCGGVDIYLDGQKADASVLEEGMMAEITYSGIVFEGFPGSLHGVERISVYSLGTKENPGGTMYDLCGLYLQVLNDLWDKDAGLKCNIDYISVDLSQAPGELTEGEQSAIAWLFGAQHEVEALSLTMEELAAEGYLSQTGPDNKYYYWENGVLFRIAQNQQEGNLNYSLPTIKFDAEKWRTPLGAYWFSDCTAVWPQMGTWTQYTVQAELIS